MIRPRLALLRNLLALLAFAPPAHAHVGSKDVFQTVHAGPYILYITVRPPNVVPGVAVVEARSSGAPISGLRITPLPVTGEAARHPPAADTMQPAAADPAFFTGAVWMMATGTWQVRFEIQGPAGTQVATVPVLAVPVATLHMQKGMGVVLALLGLFLILSMGGIVAASIREARLPPGIAPTLGLRRKSRLVMAASLLLMASFVLLGNKWWNVEAFAYAEYIFTSAPTTATLAGNQLDLIVKTVHRPSDYDNKRDRLNSDYLPDHGRLMHLYAIRRPEMDAAFHLHPALVGPGDFRLNLPSMPPGHYQLYGDVVHANGLPETLLASIDIPPSLPSAPLAPEDAEALPPPLGQGELGPSFKLPDGFTMRWDRPAGLQAGTAYTFHFTLLDPQGRPATGMQPYLGMAGHAAFVKTDGSVFAHTHPEGSAAMADVMLADASMDPQASTSMSANPPVGPSVDFPYGFPTPGRYRIFIQMKHAGTVETGVFDANVH